MAILRNQVSEIELDDAFLKDVNAGLSAPSKWLSSKYFYDELGDALFVKIMHMPEYYLTDAELEIFTGQADAMIASFGIADQPFDLIELGSGDGTKTIQLLKKLAGKVPFTYRPVDISMYALENLKERLEKEVPLAEVITMQGEYFQVLEDIGANGNTKVVLFLGSNMGNLSDKKAHAFIQKLARCFRKGDKLLLGLDLKKDPSVILSAYNDAAGITRAFNLNVLTRINRELGGNFDLEAFAHTPEYNAEAGAAESYLTSLKKQTVTIDALEKSFYFEEGERIHTEVSRKYDKETLEKIIEGSGLRVCTGFSDSRSYFTDFLLEKM